MRRWVLGAAAAASAAVTVGTQAAAQDRRETAPAAAPTPAPLCDDIKGTTLSIELVPIAPKDGSKPFLIAKTETTWDLYDVFVFGFDRDPGTGDAKPEDAADAVTRPTKPYILTDRGYGHAGYPAISMSFLGAKHFAEWLSAKTGRRYRLPTVAEWKAACERSGISAAAVDDFAWHAGNSEQSTHPVGAKKPDASGVHDLWGNVGEWCVGEDGRGVVLGGTFRDGADALGCAAQRVYSPDWNASDPQFPKSRWWLADADFVGFRLVCEP